MKVYSIYDKEFVPYGRVLDGYDCTELIEVMEQIPMPEIGTKYEASIMGLENCNIFDQLCYSAFGGIPVELGMCWGKNRTLNCLEYHRSSEINIGASEFILLLAAQQQIRDGALSTDLVRAFRVPPGLPVELYATTMHYCPCSINLTEGFRTAVLLPQGTNLPVKNSPGGSKEDEMLFACNKWLLAHPESEEAKNGAYIGLIGENLVVCDRE